MQYSLSIPCHNESVSPSMRCPTEPFLLLLLISGNYFHMAEPPADISSVQSYETPR